MATVNGVESAKLNGTPQTMADVTKTGGRLRISYDNYTITSALSVGDVINLGYLPEGARIHKARFKTDTSFGSTTLAIAVGGVTLRSAATLTATTWQDLTIFDTEADERVITTSAGNVTVTLAAAASPASAVVEVEIFYSVD